MSKTVELGEEKLNKEDFEVHKAQKPSFQIWVKYLGRWERQEKLLQEEMAISEASQIESNGFEVKVFNQIGELIYHSDENVGIKFGDGWQNGGHEDEI